jgi:creatinine amidohydrolase
LRETIYEVKGPKLLGELSSPAVKEALERTKTVVMAGGSVETHGPHLPLLSDALQGEEFIRRVVLELDGRGVSVLGGFSIPFAPAEDTLEFAGTISVRNETYMALVEDLLESLYSHGFRYFPFIPAHEQTMGPLMVVSRAFNAKYGDARAGVLSGWYIAAVIDKKAELAVGAEPLKDGHGGELEASRVISARPELVDLSLAGTHYPAGSREPIPWDDYPLAGGGVYTPHGSFSRRGPNGFVGDATLATADKGERQYALGVKWLADVIARDYVQ